MLTTVVWVTPPLEADMVTAYVPGVVRSDAETVSVTVPEPPADKATFDALRDALGSEGESPPVRLVGLTLAECPGSMGNELGLAPRLKSGDVLEILHAVRACISHPEKL